jgi:hypothetical protein
MINIVNPQELDKFSFLIDGVEHSIMWLGVNDWFSSDRKNYYWAVYTTDTPQAVYHMTLMREPEHVNWENKVGFMHRFLFRDDRRDMNRALFLSKEDVEDIDTFKSAIVNAVTTFYIRYGRFYSKNQ